MHHQIGPVVKQTHNSEPIFFQREAHVCSGVSSYTQVIVQLHGHRHTSDWLKLQLLVGRSIAVLLTSPSSDDPHQSGQ